jgi:cation diffusion facilitator family transporter
MRAAYVHVVADALTSVLAIAALVLGSLYGWLGLDPLMGIVGGLIIAQWSWSLMRSAGAVLLDTVPDSGDLPGEIRAAIETDRARITDLHVWQVGPGHHAAIVAVATSEPHEPSFYKSKLSALARLSHVTVEVTKAAALNATQASHNRRGD